MFYWLNSPLGSACAHVNVIIWFSTAHLHTNVQRDSARFLLNNLPTHLTCNRSLEDHHFIPKSSSSFLSGENYHFSYLRETRVTFASLNAYENLRKLYVMTRVIIIFLEPFLGLHAARLLSAFDGDWRIDFPFQQRAKVFSAYRYAFQRMIWFLIHVYSCHLYPLFIFLLCFKSITKWKAFLHVNNDCLTNVTERSKVMFFFFFWLKHPLFMYIFWQMISRHHNPSIHLVIHPSSDSGPQNPQ